MKIIITMSITTTILSLMIFVSSCKKEGQHPVTDTELISIEHDGNNRKYFIHVPPNYESTQSIPVLLAFHGYGGTAKSFMKHSNFNEIADVNNFIVVYPEGLTFEWYTHWNVGGWTNGSTVDDVGFVNSLLDDLEVNYNIETNKIYATGMSNGGFMSFLLACQLSERIAAVASVIGSMTPETYSACNPSHQIPILQLHGTADDIVPYQGQSDMIAIEDALSYWVEYNQTDSVATMTLIDDIDTDDGSTVEKYIYGNGNNGAKVAHYKVLNGGHDWFGAFGNMDIQSSQIVWDFLSEYDINGEL
jgi:polyhydroxybutyrate depolymerase